MSDNPLTTPKNGPAVAETALVRGDLKGLSESERLVYYRQVCESLGLNPLTQPFGYIEFQGKLRLYALRACTDQLRKIHRISVLSITRTESDGILEATVRVRDKEGREDEDIGCVVVGGLKGAALANEKMKAITKAKRRATLSICGLGWLDESELDTLPEARPALPPKPLTREIAGVPAKPQPKKPSLPKTGAELLGRLHALEARLVEEKVCEVGDLLVALENWGERQEQPLLEKIEEWPAARFGEVADFVVQWEKDCRVGMPQKV